MGWLLEERHIKGRDYRDREETEADLRIMSHSGKDFSTEEGWATGTGEGKWKVLKGTELLRKKG